MPYAYNLILRTSEDDDAPIVGVIDDSEVVTLNRFLDQYEDLANSAPMQKGVPCELTINVADGKAEVQTDLPSRDDLDILFQRLRLFILQKERASFVAVCKILRRYLADLRLRELVKGEYARFHNHPDYLSVRLIVNDAVVNQEQMLMDWIYGYQYHSDDERRERLRTQGIDIRHPSIRHKLIMTLLNKQKAIGYMAAVAAVMMGRNAHFEFYGATLTRPLEVGVSPAGSSSL